MKITPKAPYIEWKCPNCKTDYALERTAPKPHKCLKNISPNKGKYLACEYPFPDQTQRDRLAEIQDSV